MATAIIHFIDLLLVVLDLPQVRICAAAAGAMPVTSARRLAPGAGDAFLGAASGRWVSLLTYPLLTYPLRNADGAIAGLLALPLDLLKLQSRSCRLALERDEMRGHLMSRPVPPHELEAMLRADSALATAASR